MRERFFRFVVNQRKAIVAIFVVAALVGLVLGQMVRVNYDMNDYLPAETESTVALNVMEDEFGGNVPNARVMVENVSLAQALDYKNQIAAVDGVSEVAWLDDVISLSTPLEMVDQKTVETYYKNNTALFSVTIEEDYIQQAVNDIRTIIGDDNAMTGSAVSTAVATESTISEIAIITVCAVLFVLLILALTSSSWLEPLLILVGLGIAIAINRGTNLIFGEISFVTNAAGAILQIAIALDFSVFLLRRYEEFRKVYPSAADAMVAALCKMSTTITASGCTVIIGFLALCVMQFRIGPDLGYALAKGIIISLITVFMFTPGLFVLCDKWLLKTHHRSFVPSLSKFGKLVQRVCVPLACVFVLLPVPAFLASTSDSINYYYGSSEIFGTGTQYGDDTHKIENTFGKSDTYVLLVPKGDTAQEAALSKALKEVPEVTSIISFVDTAGVTIPPELADEETLSQIESEHYRRLVISVDTAYEGDATFNLVEEIRGIAQEYYPDEWLMAGAGVSTTDLMTTITHDKDLVDIIAVAAVLFVLFFATRSLILPFILVFVIETSIWCNFAVPYFDGSTIFFLSYLIVSTIQLGVTVDYAILFSERYRESRRTMPKKRAIRATVEAATIPVCTSGVVMVVVGFLLGALSTHGILAQLGHFLGVGVSISLISILFVLPGFLYLFDGLIDRLTWHEHFLRYDKRITDTTLDSPNTKTKAKKELNIPNSSEADMLSRILNSSTASSHDSETR